jgi:hypothetical protein
MIDKPKNYHVLALRSLANDLAVCDPTWTPTIKLLRDAANELETLLEQKESNTQPPVDLSP